MEDPSQYQSIVDAEWNIIYDKLDKCVAAGAHIVLSRLAIGACLASQEDIHTAEQHFVCGKVVLLAGVARAWLRCVAGFDVKCMLLCSDLQAVVSVLQQFDPADAVSVGSAAGGAVCYLPSVLPSW